MPHSKPKSRSAPGAGTIRKKTVMKNGAEYTYWEARFTTGFDPATGKQKQRSITGKTQKEVAQKLRQATTEIDQGIYIEPCRMTVGEWLDLWVSTYLTGVKARTADSYTTTIEAHLKPAFGGVRMDMLNTPAIQQFYNSLQKPQGRKKPLSAKSVRNINGVFHRALQQAVELGYLRLNPATPCKLPRVEKPEIKPLDNEAIGKFLSVIQGHRFEYVFRVTLFTGMRQGEVLGLTWDCIDFEKGLITVKQQLQRERRSSGEYHLVSPKNSKSRTLSPAPSVMALLKRQQKRQMEMRLKAGPAWTDSSYVFTDELGGNLSAQTVYLHFKKLIAKAGYPNTRFHDLRHTYAVAALHAGDDIKTVQEALGHHTAAFTLDTYAHVTEEMKRESAHRMETFIQSVSSQ